MLWQMQQYWSRQQAKRHWIGFIAGLLILSACLSFFNGLGQFDRAIIDLATRFDTRTPSPEIVIIAIDDDSIEDFKRQGLGGWPWSRYIHAELLQKLQHANAKAIGVDIFFDQPDKINGLSDSALAEALKLNHAVALPLFMYSPAEGGGWIEISQPLDVFSESVRDITHVNLLLDKDGKARSIYLREGRDGAVGGVWDHMALALFKAGSLEEIKIPGRRAPKDIRQIFEKIENEGVDLRVIPKEWLRDYWMLISYAGPPGSFKRYSYEKVYSGEIPAEEFKDKYVLIGMIAAWAGDAYSTPMAGENVLMPGVEIIANILDSLLQDEIRYSATIPQNILYNFFPVLLAFPLFYFCRPRTIVIGLACLCMMDLFVTFLFRRYVGIQVAPAASLTCLMLSYPWWSWRRLELLIRQIREEFIRMRRVNGFFQAPKHMVGDRLERDLQEFNNAAWQLRELQQMIRTSLDEIPHVVLITNEQSQVILCNAQGRKLFRTNPPLPTMAFEPAMGFENTDQQIEIPQHRFDALLKDNFFHNIEQQSYKNTYAKSLLSFIEQIDRTPSAGSIEVIDSKDGRRYLMKVIARSVFSEQAQGWLISLVNLSGELHAETQRDQLLRYLFENVKPQLDVVVRSDYAPEQTKKKVGFLASQVNAFLELEYAQMAIYFYEKINVAQCIKYAIENVQLKLNFTHWDSNALRMPDHLFLQADIHLFEKAIEELILLLVKLQASNKMPMINLKHIERTTESGDLLKLIQLYFIIAIPEDKEFASKTEFFDLPVQNKALPVDVNPNTLYWWSSRVTMMRHGGLIKINRTPRAFGVVIEFVDKNESPVSSEELPTEIITER